MVSEIRKNLALSIPMILAQLLWMTMPVVDNMMVGGLGAEALASMAIATTYYWLLQLVCLGIISSLNPLVSHAFGGNQHGAFRGFIQSGLVLSVGLAFLMMASLMLGNKALGLLGQPPNLLIGASQYLNAVVWAVPFQLCFMVFRQFLDSVEDPKPTIVLVFVGALLNAVCDYLLIYGKGGFPRLELAGAGYATALTQSFLCLGLLAYLSRSKKHRGLQLWKKNEVRGETMREMLRLGLPSSGAMLAEMAYFSGSTLIMGLLGTTEVAAHQIALNIASVTFMVPLGVSFAASVRIGGYCGKKDALGVRKAGRVGLIVCLALAVFNATLLLIFAPYIVRLYRAGHEVSELAIRLVRIAGLFQIFDGLQVLGIHSLRGIKDTRVPFFNTLFSYAIIGMGLSLVLTFHYQLGPVGFWTGMIVALAVAAVLHHKRFYLLTEA